LAFESILSKCTRGFGFHALASLSMQNADLGYVDVAPLSQLQDRFAQLTHLRKVHFDKIRSISTLPLLWERLVAVTLSYPVPKFPEDRHTVTDESLSILSKCINLVSMEVSGYPPHPFPLSYVENRSVKQLVLSSRSSILCYLIAPSLEDLSITDFFDDRLVSVLQSFLQLSGYKLQTLTTTLQGFGSQTAAAVADTFHELKSLETCTLTLPNRFSLDSVSGFLDLLASGSSGESELPLPNLRSLLSLYIGQMSPGWPASSSTL
jgi:hypothetical protein